MLLHSVCTNIRNLHRYSWWRKEKRIRSYMQYQRQLSNKQPKLPLGAVDLLLETDEDYELNHAYMNSISFMMRVILQITNKMNFL